MNVSIPVACPVCSAESSALVKKPNVIESPQAVINCAGCKSTYRAKFQQVPLLHGGNGRTVRISRIILNDATQKT